MRPNSTRLAGWTVLENHTVHAFPERECHGYDLWVSGYALLLRLRRRVVYAALWLCGGEICLGRRGVPVFLTVSSLAVLAANLLVLQYCDKLFLH